jgi:hypothetical protein
MQTTSYAYPNPNLSVLSTEALRRLPDREGCQTVVTRHSWTAEQRVRHLQMDESDISVCPDDSEIDSTRDDQRDERANSRAPLAVSYPSPTTTNAMDLTYLLSFLQVLFQPRPATGLPTMMILSALLLRRMTTASGPFNFPRARSECSCAPTGLSSAFGSAISSRTWGNGISFI